MQTVYKQSPIINELNFIKKEIYCFCMVIWVKLIICIRNLGWFFVLQAHKPVICKVQVADKGFVLNGIVDEIF